VCRHLAWTLPDPACAAAEWLRVLRPGGRLLVVDGDWVRLPAWGRVRRTVGQVLMRVMQRPSEPLDWAAHERIMAQVHFSHGLRPAPLSAMTSRHDGENGKCSGSSQRATRSVSFPPTAGSTTTSSSAVIACPPPRIESHATPSFKHGVRWSASPWLRETLANLILATRPPSST